MLRCVWIVVASAMVLVAVEGQVLGGWSGRLGSGSSGSSGSGGSSEGKPQTQIREVAVGRFVVTLPQNEAEVLRVSDDQVIYGFGGQQVIATEFADVLTALGIVLPADDRTDEWAFRYGSNGNTLVYQARHRKVVGLYVRGSVANVETLKAVLGTISVVSEPTTKPTTKPTAKPVKEAAKETKPAKQPKLAKAAK